MSRGTLDPAVPVRISCTGLSPSLAGFPKTILVESRNQLYSPNPSMHAHWFGLFPVRSPLLRKSMFLSFPPPTKMFQFRGLAHLTMCQVFYLTGCPIQKSPDQILFANPRSFSQLTTSFFASKSLGIPHTPLFTFLQLLTQPIPA